MKKIDNTKNKFLELLINSSSILLTAFLVVGVVFTFFFKVSVVSGMSMENTLHDGDKLIISTVVTDVKPGDVIVISQPNNYEKVLIKRVIAVGGQIVAFDKETGETVIDGKHIDEPYVKEDIKYTYAMTRAYVVPYGKVFVMGDNRNNSADSRDAAVGMIDEDYIIGKVIYRIGDKNMFDKETENG